jgi:hypothetical protein
LKKYLAQIGVREFILAAEWPRAALDALDVKDDLLESGEVVEVDDPELSTVALSAPGVLFERPLWARRKHYTRCL